MGEQAFPRDSDEICKKTITDLSLEYNLASKVVEKEYNSLLYKYLTILNWKNNNSNSSLEAWNEDKVVADICKTIVKNHITKVSIMFDKTKYVRTEKNLRVTFADQLSNLGMILPLGTYISENDRFFFRWNLRPFHGNEHLEFI